MRNPYTIRRLLALAALCTLALLPALVGCTTQPSDQEIRQKSAQATRDAQKGAKQLAADTKVAAAKAVDGVNAMAAGVKDGLDSNKPGENNDLVDINSASTARLALLPGISLTKAHDIVEGRPYPNTHALLRRGLLTQAQYDGVADKITAHK